MTRFPLAALAGSLGALLLLSSPASAWELTGTDWTWQAEAVETPFELNPHGWPASAGSPAQVAAAVDAARQVWNGAGADVHVVDGGLTSETSWQMDEANLLQFHEGSFGGGTLAVAQYWAAGGQTYDCDIRFYSENDQGEIQWSSSPDGADWGTFDIQYVAEHEIGHCLGLGHSDNPDSVMYAYATSGAGPEERSLDADDVAGLLAIYGDVPCLDLDGDGFTAEPGCSNSGDCDDTSEWLSPGAAEVCDNGIDDDCDGLADPSSDCPPEPPVEDPEDEGGVGDDDDAGDDAGDDDDGEELPPTDAPDSDGDGWVDTVDCDSLDPDVHPGAPEVCDGLDSDCDGELPPDELDEDGDGFTVCKGDCDDHNPETFPEAFELCDGLDNDCDSEPSEVEQDLDGDGQAGCFGDCDDSDPAVYADAPELCDGHDQDCDGRLDDELDDEDGDGFTPCGGDCDDRFDDISPEAVEVCDGQDNDCDQRIDEELDDCEELDPEVPGGDEKDPELPWNPDDPEQPFPGFDDPPWMEGCAAEASLVAGAGHGQLGLFLLGLVLGALVLRRRSALG